MQEKCFSLKASEILIGGGGIFFTSQNMNLDE
jgi:hypothetical protein